MFSGKFATFLCSLSVNEWMLSKYPKLLHTLLKIQAECAVLGCLGVALSVAVATLPMIMNNVVLLCRETRYIKTKLAALSYQATASPCRTSRGSTRGPTPASPATTWPGWRVSPYTSTSSVSQTSVDL